VAQTGGSDRAAMITDIVMTTRNRPDYLRQTRERLFKATRSPYALHLIDDASTDPFTVEYLLDQYHAGRFASLTLRRERVGIMANKNLCTWLSLSDPFVIVADDILCPDIEPDWLARGLTAMKARPKLGELALNHPGAHRINEDSDDEVTYCKCIADTFGFIRRKAIEGWHIPHYRGNFGEGHDVMRSNYLRKAGWRVGYLTDVFCYHIGRDSSIAPGRKYGGPFIPVKNWDTLEPDYEAKR